MASIQVGRTDSTTNLWTQWVLANTVGWAAAWVIFVVSAESLPAVGHAIGAILGGAALGAMQWLVLRRVVAGAGWTILASSLGLTVGFLSGWLLGGPPFDFLGAFVLVGALNGLVQWLALRKLVAGAGWWVLASALGFALGGAAAFAVAVTAGDAISAAAGDGMAGFAAVVSVMGVAGGALGGATTGTVLTRLLQRAAAARREA